MEGSDGGGRYIVREKTQRYVDGWTHAGKHMCMHGEREKEREIDRDRESQTECITNTGNTDHSDSCDGVGVASEQAIVQFLLHLTTSCL